MGFWKKGSEVPECKFCDQPNTEGHYCEGVKKAEEALGEKLDAKLRKGLAEIEEVKKRENPDGFSNDIPEGEGKICINRESRR